MFVLLQSFDVKKYLKTFVTFFSLNYLLMEKYFPSLRNFVANYSSYCYIQSVKTYEIVKIVKWSGEYLIVV